MINKLYFDIPFPTFRQIPEAVRVEWWDSTLRFCLIMGAGNKNQYYNLPSANPTHNHCVYTLVLLRHDGLNISCYASNCTHTITYSYIKYLSVILNH